MIVESKMNQDAQKIRNIKKAKEYIVIYKTDKWIKLSCLPTSVLYDFLILWDTGTVVEGRKIEIDEEDEHFRIIKTE